MYATTGTYPNMKLIEYLIISDNGLVITNYYKYLTNCQPHPDPTIAITQGNISGK